MNKIKHVIVVLFSFSGSLFAQEKEGHQSEENQSKTGVYEIINSGIYSFDPESGHGNYGYELHFTYWFNHDWGAGLGYTVLFAGEQKLVHQLTLLGSYNPTTWLTINAGPNIVFPYDGSDMLFSGYLETEFNYRAREWVHFGPVLGTIVGKKTEINLGFHLGFEF